MRRRLKWTFNLLAALSLLLFLATAAMWIWSSWYRVAYQSLSYLPRSNAEARWILNFNGSSFSFDHEVYRQPFVVGDPKQPTSGATFLARRRQMPQDRIDRLDLSIGRNEYGFHALGFRIARTHVFEKVWTEAECEVPLWPLLLGFGVLPVIHVKRRIRPKRLGLCAACGYDLRATPDHCPECGTATAVRE